jgi:hypothetical protein
MALGKAVQQEQCRLRAVATEAGKYVYPIDRKYLRCKSVKPSHGSMLRI